MVTPTLLTKGMFFMKTSLQTKIGTHVYLHKCVGRYIVIKSDKTMQYTIFQHIFLMNGGKHISKTLPIVPLSS